MKTKTKALNLTDLETKMLRSVVRNIARNLYQPSNGLSSLVKKGLLTISEATVRITEAGFVAYKGIK